MMVQPYIPQLPQLLDLLDLLVCPCTERFDFLDQGFEVCSRHPLLWLRKASSTMTSRSQQSFAECRGGEP